MTMRLLACLLALTLFATPAQAENFSGDQKKEIETIIRNYLVEHPEVLMDAMNALKEYQAQQSILRNQRLVLAHKDKLFANPNSPSIGPKDAKVTLVEFYDYNCGACKIMYNSLVSYMEENKDFRIVFKEYPIFGETSEYPARVALAVHRLAPEKYFNFHNELMSHQGRVSKEVVGSALVKLKLDVNAIAKEAYSKEVTAALADVKKLADTLGATGTPMLVLNTEVIPHALDTETLRTKVESAQPLQ